MKKKKSFLLLIFLSILIGILSPITCPTLYTPVEIQAATTLPAPEITSVKASGSSSITIKWNAVEGADGYRVYRKAAGDKSWTRITTLTNPNTLSYKNSKLKMGYTYTYTVRAYKLVNNTKNWGKYSKTGKSATTTIPAPGNVSVTASGTTSAKISWKTVSNASGYRIYRKQLNEDWIRVTTLSGQKVSSYTDKTLKTGQKYYYTVRAYRTVSGKKVWGKYDKNGFSVTTKITTPKLVSIKATSATSAKLTWNAIPDVKGYRIYRKTEGGSWQGIKDITNPNTTSYTHKSLTPGVTYYYTVRAYTYPENTLVLSSYNKTGLKVTPKLAKMTQITLKQLSSTSVQITWPKVDRADGYRVYRKLPNETSWTKLKTISDPAVTSYTDKKTELAVTYLYSVRSYQNIDGAKVWGYANMTGVSFTSAIPVPELVSAQALDHQSIKVTWKKVDGADGYRIYKKTANESKWTRIKIRAGADKVTYTSTGLNSNTQYFYTIIAYKTIDGKAVLSKYNTQGVYATTKEAPYSFESNQVVLLKGETRELAVSSGTVTSWSSGDATIVSVTNGMITAHRTGTTVITAVVDGTKLNCNVTVEDPILPEIFEVTAGESQLLTFEGTSEKVEWTDIGASAGDVELIPSGNNSVLIKGLTPGNAYISAKIGDHKTVYQCKIIVRGYIKTDRTAVTLYKGEHTEINFETNHKVGIKLATENSSIAHGSVGYFNTGETSFTIFGASPGITTLRLYPRDFKELDYVDIVVTVLEKPEDLTGPSKLVNYLERHGYMDNGIHKFKLRFYNDDSYTEYITGYERTTDTFHISFTQPTADALEEVFMSMKNGQYTEITVRYQHTTNNHLFLAETTINPATYNGELVPFKLLKTDGLDTPEINQLLEQASEFFDLTFATWEQYIIDIYARTSLKEFGFTAYN